MIGTIEVVGINYLGYCTRGEVGCKNTIFYDTFSRRKKPKTRRSAPKNETEGNGNGTNHAAMKKELWYDE